MNKPFSAVTQVLRGYTYNQVKAVVEVLVDSPVHNVEVTMNTPEAALLIQKLSSEYGSDINIGAGTVLTLEELQIAYKAGASYGYAKKVCEPLGNLPLMAVGGVTTDNIAEVFAGGYAYVGTANGIFNKNDILAEDKAALKQSLDKLIKELERLGR